MTWLYREAAIEHAEENGCLLHIESDPIEAAGSLDPLAPDDLDVSCEKVKRGENHMVWCYDRLDPRGH